MIAESDVTQLRRNSEMLRAAKLAAKQPRNPAKGETMPAGTIYKGDPPKSVPKTYSRMGNPLADEGKY